MRFINNNLKETFSGSTVLNSVTVLQKMRSEDGFEKIINLKDSSIISKLEFTDTSIDGQK